MGSFIMEDVAGDDDTVWIPADREWRFNMALQAGSAGFVLPAAAAAALGASAWVVVLSGVTCMIAAMARCWVAGLLLDHRNRVLTSKGYFVTREVPYDAISGIDVAGSPRFQGPLSEWGGAALHLTVAGSQVVLPSTNTRHRHKALRRASQLHYLLQADAPPTGIPG